MLFRCEFFIRLILLALLLPSYFVEAKHTCCTFALGAINNPLTYARVGHMPLHGFHATTWQLDRLGDLSTHCFVTLPSHDADCLVLLNLFVPMVMVMLLSVFCHMCASLENLYVRTESCPMPRPLLAHYPRKTEDSMWERIGLGHVADVSSSCNLVPLWILLLSVVAAPASFIYFGRPSALRVGKSITAAHVCLHRAQGSCMMSLLVQIFSLAGHALVPRSCALVLLQKMYLHSMVMLIDKRCMSSELAKVCSFLHNV